VELGRRIKVSCDGRDYFATVFDTGSQIYYGSILTFKVDEDYSGPRKQNTCIVTPHRINNPAMKGRV
jgi:hypothetical protein